MTVPTESFRRAIELQQEMEERSYTRKEMTPIGPVFFHDDYPHKWDLNFVRVERDATFDEIIAAADQALGGAGLKHRKVHIYDHRLGDRLASNFKDAGWRVDHLVLMVLMSGVAKEGTLEVKEVSLEEMLPVWITNDLTDNPKLTRAEAEMVAASNRVTTAAIETHFYAADVGDEVAGWCELYLENGMAQIENVGTHQRYRKRGASTSVVTHAITTAKETGAELIFLVADQNDWPKEYYARLGFEPGGYFYEFVMPAHEEPATPEDPISS
ncbi:MAG: GNAT family N-acetyltransferase [Actinomycetota bacterium]